VIGGSAGAAARLGMKRTTLQFRMTKLATFDADISASADMSARRLQATPRFATESQPWRRPKHTFLSAG
jgi:hypothetical protein